MTFTPTVTTDYSPITTIAPVLVSQETPVITWNSPAPISPNTPLSSTQLDASAADPNTGAAVAGTFVYTPAAGTLLPLGDQTLSVTFTPTDTTGYTAVTTSVTLVVERLTPATYLEHSRRHYLRHAPEQRATGCHRRRSEFRIASERHLCLHAPGRHDSRSAAAPP